MGEEGCLKDGHFHTLETTGQVVHRAGFRTSGATQTVFGGAGVSVASGSATKAASDFTSNVTDFLAEFTGRLDKGVARYEISDADSRPTNAAAPSAVELAAATIKGNSFTDFSSTNATPGVRVMGYLPPASPGTHCALKIGEELLGSGGPLDIRVHPGSTADRFAAQVIRVSGTTHAKNAIIGTPGVHEGPADYVKTIIYTPDTPATDILSQFSIIHFYCIIHNQWLVKVTTGSDTTGATGSFAAYGA